MDMVADKVADMVADTVADNKKVTFMVLDVVADKTADMVADMEADKKKKWPTWTGGCKDHLLCLYLLTTPTGQRYIVNSSSGNQLFPPCGFWPLSRPMDFNFNLHAMPILSPFPPLVVN